ncbi:MAG: tetratricopeptide repeat protein [Candidatus Hydrogenedentes bacterium]|nr:tetratricopeptide repeat protein [Candidatus Hydrogenedentota bacterium]
MIRYASMIGIILALSLGNTGCSTARSRHDPDLIRNISHPAFSLVLHQSKITVAVSPIRQTLQIGGAAATVLGAGISAVQDNKNSTRIREALGDYDPCAVFLEKMESGIAPGFIQDVEQVAPPGTTAGYNNAREAQEARLAGLRHTGYDTTLDLDLSFGIYGPRGILAVKAKGKLFDVQTGRLLWRNDIVWYSVDLFTDVQWHDPMQRATPNITAPRLSTEKDAISQWTQENAAVLRNSFEQAVDAVSAAILTDLGLRETPEGLYTLGAYLLLNKKYAAAAENFRAALNLTPNMPEAVNGLAVALAKNKQVEDAIVLNEKLLKAYPDYMPGHYNLAWWYAVDKKNPELARPHYEKAIDLGIAPSRRLKKKMEK